ncbi:hypothetical protein DVH24_017921 [Malus domestica]|uniref:Bulb-type lectin domain-containing protein n=1 Tax=Malus domestica TaxID=3750 RepID=A0A498KCI3_MALDO|nr:hypothetical protein DVH24_017921 [Malus domestica]
METETMRGYFLSSSHAQTLDFPVLLKQGQRLADQDKNFLVSENGGFFKLGFLSPGTSSASGATSDRYLGIFYTRLPSHPDAVWLANPKTPISDSSGVFTLDSEGKLKIGYSGGEISVSDSNQTVSGNVTASFQDTGNLVLQEFASNGAFGSVLWQSFDHPTNTLLPGMKLGMNFKTGQNWTLFSWLSDQVPEPGAFKLGVDPGAANQLVIWRRGDVYWTSGVWKNGSFLGSPELTRRVDLFEFTFVSSKEEKYFSYSVKNTYTYSRWELSLQGQISQSVLAPNKTTWESTVTGPCKLNMNYPDAMCIEEKITECRNGSELFVPIRGYFAAVKFLYADDDTSLAISDCHAVCWRNCTCIGYESLYTENGTGCVYMMEGAKFEESDYFGFTYILTIARNSSKDGTPTEEGKKIGSAGSVAKKWWIWFIISITLSVTVLLLGYLCYIRKIKRRFMQHTGKLLRIIKDFITAKYYCIHRNWAGLEQGLNELRSQITRIGNSRKSSVTAMKFKRLQVWDLWKQGDTQELKDTLVDSCPEDEVLKFIHLSLLCVQEYAADRPTMAEVVSMLTSDSMFFPDPKQPAYHISRSEVGSSRPDGRRTDMGSADYVPITSFLSSSHAQALDFPVLLQQGQLLPDQDKNFLVSENGGFFKLGFLSPGTSSASGATSDRYLGIFYTRLPSHPDAVWLANPKTPISDSSGVFTLDSDGKLKIMYSGGEISVSDSNQTVSGNVTASLLDTGNLVLQEFASNGAFGSVLWQSFDHPTNTLLPGMKLGMNFKTGQNWTLFSWLSDQVPEPGAFKLGMDPGAADQLVIWRRGDVYWTSGVWNNGSFRGSPELTRRVDLFEFTFVSSKEEKYFSYSVKNTSTYSRWELSLQGQISQSILAPNKTTWESTVTGPCKLNMNYPDAMCIEEKITECRNGSELFVPIRGYFAAVKFLYDDDDTSLAISDCHAACWRNCTCIGYESLYTDNGTGCVYMMEGAKFEENDYYGFTYILTIGRNSSKGQEQGLSELRSQITRIGNVHRLKLGKSIGQEFQMFSFSGISRKKLNHHNEISTKFKRLQAWDSWKQGDTQELKDTSLDSCPEDEVLKFIHLSLLCVQESATDRPTMAEVISMLTSDSMFFPDPKQPAYYISRSEVGPSRPDGRRPDMGSADYVPITVMEASRWLHGEAFCCCFSHYLPPCYAEIVLYTLKQGEQLRDQESDHLVSQRGDFKLGFFSPGASSNLGATSNRFLGIWYSKLPNHPDAVWVGNPETPVVDSSGVFVLDSDGKMKIKHGGGEIIVWDYNQTVSGNVTGYMMDTGNFMLREVASDGTPGKILWESFDYPSNTLLPGMKLGLDFRTGRNRTISSWFSDQVPTPGAFRLSVDPSSTNRLIIWRRDVVYWTSGIWESGSFQRAPELTSRADLFEFNFVSNAEEKYFTYTVKNNSTLSRWELNTWGQLMQSILGSDGTTWETTATSPCTSNPNYLDAVCIKQTTSECRNGSELFLPMRGYSGDAKLTYNDSNTNLDLSDCHATCWSDCTCVGYGPLYHNGSGCLYMREGVHYVKSDYFGVNYFATIANNSRDGAPTEKGSTKREWWIWCIVGIVIAVALLLLGYFCYTRKRKLQQVQQTGKKKLYRILWLLNYELQVQTRQKQSKSKDYLTWDPKSTDWVTFSNSNSAKAEGWNSSSCSCSSSSSSFFSSSSSSSSGGSYGIGGGRGVFIGLNCGKMSGLRPGFGLSHSCNTIPQHQNLISNQNSKPNSKKKTQQKSRVAEEHAYNREIERVAAGELLLIRCHTHHLTPPTPARIEPQGGGRRRRPCWG